MSNAEKSDKITITLTDARPMRVSKTLWPLAAMASKDRDHNNRELFHRYYLRVRVHARRTDDYAAAIEYYGGEVEGAPMLAPHGDGRAVVYGWYESSYQGEDGAQAGYETTLDEAAVMVRKVGEAIGAPEHVITECCADLPAVEAEERDELGAQIDEVRRLVGNLGPGATELEVIRGACDWIRHAQGRTACDT